MKAQEHFKRELSQPPNFPFDKELSMTSLPIGLIDGCQKHLQLSKRFHA